MHKAAIIKSSVDGCQIMVGKDSICDEDTVMTSKYVGHYPKMHEGRLVLKLCAKHATPWFTNGSIWKKIDAQSTDG